MTRASFGSRLADRRGILLQRSRRHPDGRSRLGDGRPAIRSFRAMCACPTPRVKLFHAAVSRPHAACSTRSTAAPAGMRARPGRWRGSASSRCCATTIKAIPTQSRANICLGHALLELWRAHRLGPAGADRPGSAGLYRDRHALRSRLHAHSSRPFCWRAMTWKAWAWRIGAPACAAMCSRPAIPPPRPAS